MLGKTRGLSRIARHRSSRELVLGRCYEHIHLGGDLAVEEAALLTTEK